MIQSIIGTYGVNVINGSGNNIYVSGDHSPGVNGELRMMGNNMYVWANNYWNLACGSATIELTPEVHNILDWGKRAMKREEEMDKLIAKYPSVKTAKEQLDIMVALTKDYKEE